MKKRYIVATLLLVVLLIGPKIVATMVPDQVNTAVSKINSVSGYKATLVELNEGWFSSTGKVLVELDMMQIAPDIELGDASQTAFEIEFNAHHGPVYLDQGLGLGWINWSASFMGESLRETLTWEENTDFYQLNTTFGIFGGLSIEDSITEFTAIDKGNGESLVFSGYQGEGGQSGKQYYYEGKTQSVEMIGQTGDVAISNVSVAMQVEGDIISAFQGKLVDSSFVINLENASFTDRESGQLVFNVEDLKVSAESHIDDKEELARMTQQMAVTKLVAMGYEAADLNLELEVNNLSVGFIRKYQDFVQTLDGASELQIQQQISEFLQNNTMALLTPEPEINVIDFSGKLKEGQFDVSSNNKVVGVDALPANPQDPGFWISHMQSNTQMTMDKDVVKMLAARYMISQLKANPQTAAMPPADMGQLVSQQVPMMIDTLIQQGMLIEKDNQYTLNFVLKDSTATLNGNPVPLPY